MTIIIFLHEILTLFALFAFTRFYLRVLADETGIILRFKQKCYDEKDYVIKKMREFSMEPIKNDKQLNTKSEVEALLNKLRKTGITAILTMNKKAQITVSNWAHDLVNQYNTILKTTP